MEPTFAGLPLPLRIKPPHPLTDEELLRFNTEHRGQPFERDAEGYLLLMTPANTAAGQKNAYISARLFDWAEDDGTGLTFDSSAGFTLPDGSMRSPDASWLSHAKWDAVPRDAQERYAPVCPQFIIELRSPSDFPADLHRKMEMWLANGAELAWLVDPVEKTVTIYRPGSAPERIEGASQVSGEGPVAGFVLPLARVFR